MDLTSVKENFPKVLVKLLHEKSCTVEELSRKSGITEREIYFLKKGRYTPKLKTMNSIAQSFNMELSELLFMVTNTSQSNH